MCLYHKESSLPFRLALGKTTRAFFCISVAFFFSCALFKKNHDIRSKLATFKDESLEIYFSGSTQNVSPITTPALALMGGGTDQDDAWAWFLKQANFGDVVAIRGSGGDGYNDMLINLGANSVSSIVVKSAAAASNPQIIERIRNAEAIFFAGGDQSDYARKLPNSPAIKEINAAAKRGIPIGGTSAGLAILGEFYFPAFNDSISSAESLSNPYHERLVLDRALLHLPSLEKMITDSHFKNRDRFGRLLAFMARIINDNWSDNVKGIALDEKTTLAIGQNGDAQIFSEGGHAYLLESTGRPQSCKKDYSLTFEKIKVWRLPAGTQFNFSNWKAIKFEPYEINVTAGLLSSSAGSIY